MERDRWQRSDGVRLATQQLRRPERQSIYAASWRRVYNLTLFHQAVNDVARQMETTAPKHGTAPGGGKGESSRSRPVSSAGRGGRRAAASADLRAAIGPRSKTNMGSHSDRASHTPPYAKRPGAPSQGRRRKHVQGGTYRQLKTSRPNETEGREVGCAVPGRRILGSSTRRAGMRNCMSLIAPLLFWSTGVLFNWLPVGRFRFTP
ncbi:hypothetical protein VTG60DRAFT_1290 [Thermothelomyces hinnuleus]